MLDSDLYLEDLKKINFSGLPWEKIENCSVLVTGGTGLVGSCLVDTLIYRNEYMGGHIGIWVLCRSGERAAEIFKEYLQRPYFHMVYQDVSEPIRIEAPMDYIIHAASKGDPKSFVSDPVGIMNANILGMHQILAYANKEVTKKVVYISSGEVYGKLELSESEKISETMMGILDPMQPRNCYGMSKRAAETMCASAYEQYRTPAVVARLCHTYGPTMLPNENRVIFQFVGNALEKKDIILKSEGLQKRSYCYVADAAQGIFTILLKGLCGEAYNVANGKAVISIRELAECISDITGCRVITEDQTAAEKKENSGIMHAVLDDTKLCRLGYSGRYDISEGLRRMMDIIKEIRKRR